MVHYVMEVKGALYSCVLQFIGIACLNCNTQKVSRAYLTSIFQFKTFRHKTHPYHL